MPTSPRIPWPRSRIASVSCVPSRRTLTTQIWHKPKNANGLPEGKPLIYWLRDLQPDPEAQTDQVDI
jgi:hypothetical protein